MRISKLSAQAGLPVGTVKFYLRSGLLHSGHSTSATQALYDDTHLARLRLVRALHEVGGLSLAEIQRVLDAIDLPTADTGASVALVRDALAADSSADAVDVSDAVEMCARSGWQVPSDAPQLPRLARALSAARAVGLRLEPAHVAAYVDAACRVADSDRTALAEADDADLPTATATSTVLLDQVLVALRRLAAAHPLREPCVLDGRPAES